MARLFRDFCGPPCVHQGSVVCLGAFDGLHIGHQALVEQTVTRARALGRVSVAVCFEPLPREFFNQSKPPARLSLLRDRIHLLSSAGIDIIFVLRFTTGLSQVPAETFISEFLVCRLFAQEVWIGPGFRFGQSRRGDLSMLRRLGAQYRFTAQAIPAIVKQGQVISSTRIRQLLAQGQLAEALGLLGRHYCVSGHVVRGRQLGRTLGFPTANIRFKCRPALTGVFVAWVCGITDVPMSAVVNVGMRPTVGGHEYVIEAHVLNYNAEFYGRLIRVEFVAKLRDEKKFENLAQLTHQIQQDALAAERLLRSLSP